MKSHSKSSSLGTPWLTKKHKDITAKHQDGMIAGIRNASIRDIFLDPRIFILQQQGKERWGWGVGVNGHAHRYVLILPAKQIFLFFRVKASLGDDSSSWNFTFGQRKCLGKPPV